MKLEGSRAHVFMFGFMRMVSGGLVSGINEFLAIPRVEGMRCGNVLGAWIRRLT